MKVAFRAMAVAMLMAVLPTATGAATLSLQDGAGGYGGTADNSIYEDRPDSTSGGFPYIFAGATVSSQRRALIRFELPPDFAEAEQLVAAELTLVLERSGLDAQPDTYRLHRLLRPWGEGNASGSDSSVGGLGYAASTGDATWSAAAFDTTPWTAPGGDYVAAPSAELVLNRWDPVFPESNVYTFSGAGLTDDVRHFLEHPEQNNGWILIGNEGRARSARRFHSSEAAAQALRPRLTLTSGQPPDGWFFH